MPKAKEEPTVEPTVEPTAEPEVTEVVQVADKTKHILVDFQATGDHTIVDQPEGWENDRTLIVQGVRIEHSGLHNGVWCYRATV